MVNLPFLQPLQQKREKKEYFLSLLLKPFKVGAILFEENAGKLSILASKEEELSTEVEKLSEKELLEIADKVISGVEEHLREGEELKKTIFSLPYNYIAEGKIKREYLTKFKKLCEELSLTPLGFIVAVEAIVYFLQKKEGVPLTSIVIEITKDTAYVYMVKSGAIIEVKFSERKENLSETIEKILKHVETFEVLPTRIILLAYEGIEQIQQELLSYTWTKNLPFLHHPQVVCLEKGFEDEAIVNGVASQMGIEVLLDEVHKKNDTPFQEHITETSGKDFGFIKDQDVAHNKEVDEPSEDIPSDEQKEDTDEIPIRDTLDSHVDKKEENKHVSSLTLSSMEGEQKLSKYKEYEVTSAPSQKRASPRPFIGKLPDFLPKGIKLPSFLIGQGILTKALIGFVILVALLIGTSYVYYNYLLRAEVRLFLTKKTIDKSLPIAFTPDVPTNVNDKTLALKTIEVEKEDSLTVNTTGKKETGEKAKGELTIFNKTEQKKTLTKGTKASGANGLEFELTGDVTIASTSAFSTNFSSSKANIEASKFGSEYNLPSNTNFTFKDYSTSMYIAKNESALSGGTKKELQVVSKKDMDNLQKQLLDKLNSSAQDALSSQGSSDSVVLPFVLSSEFVTKTFNKKEGEEAKQLTLSGKVKFTGGEYNKKDLESFIKDLTKSEVPPDYSLLDESKHQVKDEEIEKNGNVSALLQIHSVYGPTILSLALRDSLIGKSVQDASKIIEKTKNVTDYKILYSTKIPLFPEILPFNKNNITITVRVSD